MKEFIEFEVSMYMYNSDFVNTLRQGYGDILIV